MANVNARKFKVEYIKEKHMGEKRDMNTMNYHYTHVHTYIQIQYIYCHVTHRYSDKAKNTLTHKEIQLLITTFGRKVYELMESENRNKVE